MTGSWWWRIVAEHLDLHSDDTALLKRDAGGGGHVPTVQILFAWSTFYSQDGPQVAGVVASF